MPADFDQDVPNPVVWCTPVPWGLHTNRLPSAAAATVPPPLTPEGSVPANQLAPLSVENAMCSRSTLPARTTVSGFDSAKSRLVVEVKFGRVNIIDGTFVRSVCRKPPMSPSALSSGAPDGGEARSLTAVSSRPRTMGVMANFEPESQFVRFSVP
ncbi:hypothetical protein SGRIM128S_05414 [Streptomyces griseomycini]